MRLEEQDPQYTIGYTPGDIPSMREALQQYSELVSTGKAFKSDYCIAHFEPTADTIPLSHFESHPKLIQHLKGSAPYYPDKDSEDPNLKEATLTETLFFLCAAMHPELKADLKSAAERIVAYARKINDSSCMWITSEEPFGIDPLVIVATIYPQYGYLLAGFMVPYWDDEHMPESLYRLAEWAHKFGITEDTIKAFCYCDNAAAREQMLGYSSFDGIDTDEKIESSFDLLQHFKNSPEDYQLFKDSLVERFQKQPFLQYSDHPDDFNPNPVESMVMDMMMIHYPYDSWDDDFDKDEYLIQHFVKDTAENEIAEINTYIQEKLGRSIVSAPSRTRARHYTPQQLRHESTLEHPFKNWELFITDAIFSGDNLWDYIQFGNKEYELKHVLKEDIYRQAEIGEYELFNDFEGVCDMEDLWEDLDRILTPLFQKYIAHARKESKGSYDPAFLLRFLEVLFALNGSNPFSEEVRELVISEYELCNEQEFDARYPVDWFTQLEIGLNEFGRYSHYVTREDLVKCWNLIDLNRAEACKKLPSTLFTIRELISEEDEIRFNVRYGAAETLALAALILHEDDKKNVFDDLTEAAKAYVELHTVDKLLYDLLDATDFPKRYIINMIASGKENTLTEEFIQECKSMYPAMEALEQYVREGYIATGENRSSAKDSEAKALSILHEHLEYDDEEISAKQKQVNWLRNFSHDTQKLLYVAHIGAMQENLSNSNALKRILRLAFELAPVRVTHMLSKVYKQNEYRLDDTEAMLDMLEKFQPQGLSDAGFWGYLMEQYAGEDDIENLPYYQMLLAEWRDAKKRVSRNNFLRRTHEKQRKALAEGYELLPRRVQLIIVDDAAKLFPEHDFTNHYNNFLLDRVSRELQMKFKVHDLPFYFKNRLEYEGIYCEYVDWTEWEKHPELLEHLLTGIPVNKPEHLSEENCYDQLRDREGWKYIVLQKQGENLVPVYGKEELWLIQNGFDAENINAAQIKAIIIDDTCPQANYDELMALSKIDYKKEWIRTIGAYLMGGLLQKNVEYIFRCGIYDYEFLKRNNYHDVDVEDLILKVQSSLQQFTFCMLGMVSHKCLNLDLDLSEAEYLDLLIQYRVDRNAIFKRLVAHNAYRLIQKLAQRVDVSPFVLKEKIADQIKVLSVLAHMPPYHPLIISLENSKSAKLQKHVEMLINHYQIKTKELIPFQIVDYGIYTMGGSTDPQAGSPRQTAREPQCTQQTDRLKGEVGMFFGLRFTTTDPNRAPQVLVHKVTVNHPQKDAATQEIVQACSQWEQDGYSSSNIFMGWCFETEDEIIPGEYHMAAHDTDGKLIVEKLFVVE